MLQNQTAGVDQVEWETDNWDLTGGDLIAVSYKCKIIYINICDSYNTHLHHWSYYTYKSCCTLAQQLPKLTSHFQLELLG